MLVPEVGQELRTPCISPAREFESVADAALIVTDLVQDRDCANAKIIAIDGIMSDVEARASAK